MNKYGPIDAITPTSCFTSALPIKSMPASTTTCSTPLATCTSEARVAGARLDRTAGEDVPLVVVVFAGDGGDRLVLHLPLPSSRCGRNDDTVQRFTRLTTRVEAVGDRALFAFAGPDEEFGGIGGRFFAETAIAVEIDGPRRLGGRRRSSAWATVFGGAVSDGVGSAEPEHPTSGRERSERRKRGERS